MALVESVVRTVFQQLVKKSAEGDVQEVKKVKITRRIYPCRAQVNQRKTWQKFGQVKGVVRGQHKKGDFTLNQQPLVFELDDANEDDELDLVKQLKKVSAEAVALKQIRNAPK